MSNVLVDSNVVLDVLTGDVAWSGWSSAALAKAGESGALIIINPIVYAEISVSFTRIEDVDAALPLELFRRETIPFEAGFLAGKAYLAYRRRDGTRTSPLPDFFIGAHAALAGYRLLTRDPVRFRTYFPTLEIIAP